MTVYENAESADAVADSDVVVVGGGPIGLSLALAFDRAGLAATLVERGPWPGPQAASGEPDANDDGRTTAIAYGTQRILTGIGAWDAIAPFAEPIADIRVSDGPSRFFVHYDHRALGDAPLGYIVENRRLKSALVALIARTPVAILSGGEVAAVERNDGGAVVRLADGRRAVAPLIAACDGPRSELRRLLDIPVTRWDCRQSSVVCTVDHELPHRGVAHERFLPGGPLAVLPMQGQRSSIVWTERTAAAEALMKLPPDAFVAELARRFGPSLGALRLAGQRWLYPLRGLLTHRYATDRAALVGDAAHVIHPIAGQGFNLGMRDVAALAEIVVDAHRLGLDTGRSIALDDYARWRRFDTLALTAATEGLNRLFSNDFAPLRLARDLGLGAVEKLPPLKRFFMRHAMGIATVPGARQPRLATGHPL